MPLFKYYYYFLENLIYLLKKLSNNVKHNSDSKAQIHIYIFITTTKLNKN